MGFPLLHLLFLPHWQLLLRWLQKRAAVLMNTCDFLSVLTTGGKPEGWCRGLLLPVFTSSWNTVSIPWSLDSVMIWIQVFQLLEPNHWYLLGRSGRLEVDLGKGSRLLGPCVWRLLLGLQSLPLSYSCSLWNKSPRPLHTTATAMFCPSLWDKVTWTKISETITQKKPIPSSPFCHTFYHSIG